MINNQPPGQYLLAVNEEVDFVSLGTDPLPDCMKTSRNLTLNWPPGSNAAPPLFFGPGLVLDLNM